MVPPNKYFDFITSIIIYLNIINVFILKYNFKVNERINEFCFVLFLNLNINLLK